MRPQCFFVRFLQASERIDLGIAVAHALNPGRVLSLRDIASYADCSPETIAQIERKAMAKVREALRRQRVGICCS
jgi:hypothetical protein